MSELSSDGRKLGDGQGQLFILLGATTMGFVHGGIAMHTPVILHAYATVLAFLFRQFDRASLDAIMPTNVPFPRRHSRSPDSYRVHLQTDRRLCIEILPLCHVRRFANESGSSGFHGNRLTLFQTLL